MITQSVGGAVAPVHVPMTFTLLNRSDGTFPAEGVVRTLLPLYKAAARETHELRVHLPQHIGQIRTHTVLTVLERRRKEAHHIYLYLSYPIEYQGKLRLWVIVVGGKGRLIFLPSLILTTGETVDDSLSIEL